MKVKKHSPISAIIMEHVIFLMKKEKNLAVLVIKVMMVISSANIA